MVRLPHVLNYTLTTTSEPTRNAAGDLIPGIATTVSKSVKCRLQPNVRASYLISEADGSKLDFSAVIFLKSDAEAVPIGQTVTVMADNEQLQTGTVKRFHRGQLHCRAWI